MSEPAAAPQPSAEAWGLTPEARIARLEQLVTYLCQLLGVQLGPEGQEVEPDLEAQHARFVEVVRGGKVLKKRR